MDMLKKDLINEAVKRGHNRLRLNRMKKLEIVHLLELPVQKAPRPKQYSSATSVSRPKSRSRVVKTATVKPSSVSIAGRPCGPNRSKISPNAYTKDELVDLAVELLHLKKSVAVKLTKVQLCERLQRKETVPARVVKKSSSLSVLSSVRLRDVPVSKVSLRKSCIERSRLPLQDHQVRVVEHMKKSRGLIVTHGVGSGKTLLAVTVSQCYLDSKPKGRVLVVTPTSLQENFKKEIKAYGADPSDPRYTYMTIQKFANHYRNRDCEKDTLLIIDEAHNLRTKVRTARIAKSGGKKSVERENRAVVALKCARKADKVLLLTATSVYNNPYDLTNLVAMVRGERPLTVKEFDRVTGSPSLFSNYFSCIMSIYDSPKNENYPTYKEHYVEIEMSDEYYKMYRDVETKNSPYFSYDKPMIFYIGVRQASNSIKDCPKCMWVMDKINTGKKTVVYSAFITYGVMLLQKILREEGIPYSEVTGSMTKSSRDEAVKQYNTDKVNVLFITKAGGEGLDLKGTRYVIVFESSWNRPTEEQVMGRAIRYKSHSHLPESERHVDVYYLLLVKPRYSKDDFPSADSYLRHMTEEKDKLNRAFIKRLVPLTIEHKKC